MKKVKHVIPFIDIVFQALGALIVVMASLEHVESIPVNLAAVSKQAVVTQKMNKPLFVAISKNGVFLGKDMIEASKLSEMVKGREIIVRVDKNIPYGRVVRIVSDIRDEASNIALEVEKDG